MDTGNEFSDVAYEDSSETLNDSSLDTAESTETSDALKDDSQTDYDMGDAETTSDSLETDDDIAESTDEDIADTKPDTALMEDGEFGELASDETGTDTEEGANEDIDNTESDTALIDDGELEEPASAETGADMVDGADEDIADTEPDTALLEETGELEEPASDATGDDTAEGADEETADTEPDTALSDETDEIEDLSALDDRRYETKPASDMVDPEEYSQYKDLYDSVDRLKADQPYKDGLVENVKTMDPDLKGLENKYANQFNCVDSEYQGIPGADPNGKGFRFDYKEDSENPLGQGNTYFHESAHQMDILNGQEEGHNLSEGLSDTVRKDYDDNINRISQQHNNCDGIEANKILAKEFVQDPDKANVVSDVFGGTTKNEIYNDLDEDDSEKIWGHSAKYWNDRGPDAVGKEAWAGITADRACGNTENMKFTEKYMPKTMKAYDNAVKRGGG